MWLSVRNSLSNGFIWLLAFQINHHLQTEVSSPPGFVSTPRRDAAAQCAAAWASIDIGCSGMRGQVSASDVVTLFIAMENDPSTSIAKTQQVRLEEGMYIEIRAKEFTLTDGIRLHIERRLGFALDRFAQRIPVVRVYVRDINGPRHGADDKCCRLSVRLAHKLLVLEERAVDLYEAIDRAAHRVRKMIARAVKRGKRHQHFSE